MKKSIIKKCSNWILIFAVLSCAFIIIFGCNSSSRILLRDQAKADKIILHNAKDAHYCHCFPPMIPYTPGFEITDIGSDRASFRWLCDQPATYQVNYGLTGGKGTLFPSTRPSVYYTDYTVTVTGLEPNTEYHAAPYAQISDSAWNVYNQGAIPKAKTFLMDNTSQNDWTFTTLPAGSTYSISGYVRMSGGTGVSGVTVTLSGDASSSDTTPSSGYYEFANLSQGNYTVTPSKSAYTFTPQNRSFNPLDADQTNQNFTAQATSIVVRSAISSVLSSKITANSATITWKTNVLSTSRVEYGANTDYGFTSGENTELAYNHYIQLFNLAAGKTYHYRAVSSTRTGETPFYSSNHTFTTPGFEDRIVDKINCFNEPNPCSDKTNFNYYLYQKVDRLMIDVYTISGKKIAVLEGPSSALGVGWNRISWDLKDNSRKSLPRGLYVYTMRFKKGGTEVDVKKTQLMVK